MNSKTIRNFIKTVQDFYTEKGRHDLPWRKVCDPYKIALSEIMLQQTQVSRVIGKYNEFITQFPSIQTLAASNLTDVLRLWSGLGYNRRAKYLHQMAKTVRDEYGGKFPKTSIELNQLPGIGAYTAGAIISFAYNKPATIIETNIRTVYIHHFFSARKKVADAELLPLIEHTLDQENPREWYWALMDYGTFLKASGSKVHRTSASYAKQSPFKGSRRQLRGDILRVLLEKPQTLQSFVRIHDKKQGNEIKSILHDLVHEGLVKKEKGRYIL